MRRQVIVVGAGPTGLWLSAELKLAGIDVLLIEKRPEPTPFSKSLTIHGRTLETYSLRGLADRLLARGMPLPGWHFANLPVRLGFSQFEARHPFMLFIPQTATEDVLAQWAEELGVDIRREHCLEELVEEDGHVRAVVSAPDGMKNIEADYVIGADGARSMVRQLADIDYLGVESTLSVMMADATVNLPPEPTTVGGTGPEGGATILPLGNGQHRIICFDAQRRHVDVREAPTLEDIVDALRNMGGKEIEVRDPTWLTRFGNETKLADRYRNGRIFIAGDAAHIHAPMGGQGMNVGAQDAMNLGWKLAAVLKGHAPEALLDSYESERRPVGERLYENTMAQGMLAMTLEPEGFALRKIVAEFLANPQVNHEMAAELSGFGLTYPEPLILGDVAGPDTGMRVPDSDLTLEGKAAGSIFGHMANGKWLSLSLSGDVEAPAPDWLADAAIHRATGTPVADFGSLKGFRAMLIRPDGYLASAIRD